jgi:ribonuclease BN (tRNA processing enzyme)
MQLTVLGFSPPYPNPNQATSGYLLEAGESVLLLDCGHGVAGKLRRAKSPEDLDAVVITHMHPDHCADLFALRNLLYHLDAEPIPLWLPTGAEEMLKGMAQSLELGDGYFQRSFLLNSYDPGEKVDLLGVEARTHPTVHPIPTALLDIRAAGRRLVYTADTAWFDELPALCRGSDLLVAECTNHPVANRPEERWHLGVEDLARLMRESSPEKLLVVHYESAGGPSLRAKLVDRLGSSESVVMADDMLRVPV